MSHFLWAGRQRLMTRILITLISVCCLQCHIAPPPLEVLPPFNASFFLSTLTVCSFVPNHLWAGAELRLLWDERWPWHGDECGFSGWLHLISCSTSVIELLSSCKKKLVVLSNSWAGLLPPRRWVQIWVHRLLPAWCTQMLTLRHSETLCSEFPARLASARPLFRRALLYLPKTNRAQWLLPVPSRWPPSFTLASLPGSMTGVFCVPRGFQVTLERGVLLVLMDTQ